MALVEGQAERLVDRLGDEGRDTGVLGHPAVGAHVLGADAEGPLRWLSSPARIHGSIIFHIRPSAPPAESTSESASRSTPSFAAVAKPSAMSAHMPMVIELLTSLQVVPAPSGPQTTIVSA